MSIRMKLAVIVVMGAFLYVVYSVFLLENPEIYVIGDFVCDFVSKCDLVIETGENLVS